MFTENDIVTICECYGITATKISDVIDTSHNDNDLRYNYVINDSYMLKINNASMVNEAFITNVSKLLKRYRDIGIYCPKLFQNNKLLFTHKVVKDNVEFTCYVEEYAKYQVAKETDVNEYDLKKQMLGHLGKLASIYTNVDLVETKSMWSIIDLAPFDNGIDEKQENMNMLVECLKNNGYDNLANELDEINKTARCKIQDFFSELPRCVYQGDLNSTNILVDEHNNFIGIIDFNMFGTEVNINCFLNEAMYYLEEKDFCDLAAEEILHKMQAVQNDLMKEILTYYTLNNVEQECISKYNKIIFMSFYPNVAVLIHFLNKHEQEDKVIRLLKLISEL